MRSCQITQSFYGYSAFEADWKGEKTRWLPHELSTNQKLSFWRVVFSYFTQQQGNISLLGSDVQWKVDFMWTTSSMVGPRKGSKALPKAKFAPK